MHIMVHQSPTQFSFPREKISFKYFCKPSASNELDTAFLIARYLILGRAVQREVDITTNYKWTQGGRRWQQEKKATFSSNVSMLNICWNTEDMLSSFAVNCIQTVSPLESVCILQYKPKAKLWNLNVEIFEHAALGRGGREMLTGQRCCTSLAVCHFIWPI